MSPRIAEDPPGYILERDGVEFSIGFDGADFDWKEIDALRSQIVTWNLYRNGGSCALRARTGSPRVERIPLDMIKIIKRIKAVFPGSRLVDQSKPELLSEYFLQVTE